MMLWGVQINYMPDKSYVIIIISNTLGQIIQINFIRKDCLTWIMLQAANSIYSLHFAVWPTKTSFLERAVCHLAACSDNNGCDLPSLGQSPRLVCFEDVFWCFSFLSLALFPWQKFHWPWRFPSLFCWLSWASAYVLSFASHVIGPIYLLIVLSNHRHCLSTVCHFLVTDYKELLKTLNTLHGFLIQMQNVSFPSFSMQGFKSDTAVLTFYFYFLSSPLLKLSLPYFVGKVLGNTWDDFW